jgi:hypothetical protein
MVPLLMLLQALIFGLACLTVLLVIAVLHAPVWVGVVAGLISFPCMWLVYLVWQSCRPNWWAPWDEGLPQADRMLDAFMPAFITFCLLLMLLPEFLTAREKALRNRQRGGPAHPVSAQGPLPTVTATTIPSHQESPR